MDRVFQALTVLAVVFLSYMLGAAAMHFRWLNMDDIAQQFQMLEAGNVVKTKKNKLTFFGVVPPRMIDRKVPPMPENWDPGARIKDLERMQPGYTLYTPMMPWAPVKMIDADGNVVHEWKLPEELKQIDNRDDGFSFPREINPLVSDFHLYKNGNLLVTLDNDLGFSPIGYAAVLLDKDSNIIWKFSKMAHHQVDVASDGRIAVMLNDEITQPWEGLNIKVPFREDQVVILSPEGQQRQYISILRAIQDSPWKGVLKHIRQQKSFDDKLHANAAKFITAEQAELLPNAREGDLLISLRNIDTILVLDPRREKVRWAMRGPWMMQHDPHILSNGNIMLFDNHGGLKNPRQSRILEIDPHTNQIVWEWPGEIEFDMYTSVNGALEPLENGNVLIAESSRGRMLEVTREGEVVWEYIVPERREFKTRTGEVILGIKVWHPKRVQLEELDFVPDGLQTAS